MQITIAGVDVTLEESEWREVLAVVAEGIFDDLGADRSDDELFDEFKYDMLEEELENAINKSLESKYIEVVCSPDYWNDRIDELEREYE